MALLCCARQGTKLPETLGKNVCKGDMEIIKKEGFKEVHTKKDVENEAHMTQL